MPFLAAIPAIIAAAGSATAAAGAAAGAAIAAGAAGATAAVGGVSSALAIGATVASAGASMYSQSQQSKAASTAARYNNKLAEQEAHNQEVQGSEAIRRQRENNRASLSELRLAQANSGLVTTEGAPLMLLGETAGRMEIGIADAARNAGMQAASLRAKGAMGIWEAKQTATAANVAMAGTAIGALSSVAGGFADGTYRPLSTTRTRPLN